MATAALALEQFDQQLEDYRRWREQLADAIESYKYWYEANARGEDPDGQSELRFFELIDSLRADKINVALVGEFSRGKTELINALFFSDYQRRLLPTTPGRTTMCPTEILYERDREPGIRLLPIETRASALTVAEHKRTPINWTTIPFDLESPEEMATALSEIENTKRVNGDEAERLGLTLSNDPYTEDAEDGLWEIPVWRHAIVNYPHPLLKQGLVVLDTPGLNALGSEPELTFSMLPSAHAILFVLAADTGVTRTDLDVWQSYVGPGPGQFNDSRIVALNKIDTLWDDLTDDEQLEAFIDRQVEESGRLLNLDRKLVFPVSAQKGLVGKMRNDRNLIERSGLPSLESKLSRDIVLYKRELVRDKIANEIGGVMQASRYAMESRMSGLVREVNEIHELRGKSQDVIDDMVVKLENHKQAYDLEVKTFKATQKLLSSQVRSLLRELSMARFDVLVKDTRAAMQSSWTTQGLRTGIATFFEGTAADMENVELKADNIHSLANEIYDRFHKAHNLPRMKPARLNVDTFKTRFDRLAEEAENFRKSPTLIATEQHYVIKKFFITLVSRARILFEECNDATRGWAKAVLMPIYAQIREHQITINRRLDNLTKIKSNHASLGGKVEAMEKELEELEEQRRLIDDVLDRLKEVPSMNEIPEPLPAETPRESLGA